ncbi:MAG: hypothetical protein J0M00_14570 [Burkholderiales bacterium]|nr:hypothetical protein [Burkholderiales bacterium]
MTCSRSRPWTSYSSFCIGWSVSVSSGHQQQFDQRLLAARHQGVRVSGNG